MEKRREKRVAGSDMVDEFRLARIKLNEFRGSGAGVGGGEGISSSSGVVTIMVTGASGEFWKIVEEFLFRRFNPSETYLTTPGLLSVGIGGSSTVPFSLLRNANTDCRFERLESRIDSGLATERIDTLPSSSSLGTMRGIGRGSRYGAESFHKTSTAESSSVEFSVSVEESIPALRFSAHMGVGMGTSTPVIYTPFPLCTSFP